MDYRGRHRGGRSPRGWVLLAAGLVVATGILGGTTWEAFRIVEGAPPPRAAGTTDPGGLGTVSGVTGPDGPSTTLPTPTAPPSARPRATAAATTTRSATTHPRNRVTRSTTRTPTRTAAPGTRTTGVTTPTVAPTAATSGPTAASSPAPGTPTAATTGPTGTTPTGG